VSNNILRHLFEDADLPALTGVDGLFFRDIECGTRLLIGLHITLENYHFCIEVTDEDSLRICPSFSAASDADQGGSVVLVKLSEFSPWKSFLGKHLMWFWALTNQQGYQDGFQLEFAGTSPDIAAVQLIAMAGTVRIRSVNGFCDT
jgi:hypothetical protein